MAKVSKSIILAYNKCASLMPKWVNIWDSVWHKDEKIPASALADDTITPAVRYHYADLQSLISAQENQKIKEVFFILDASSFSEVEDGYAYYEYIGTTNGDETDYRLISAQEFLKKPREYKLFCKTNSTNSNWFIEGLNVKSETFYKVIDNGNGLTLKEGFFSPVSQLTANLSTSTGDVSVWVEVNEDGNGAISFRSWNTVGNLTYINYDVFPLLEVIAQYYSTTTTVVGGLFNLKSFDSYSANYIGLNFQNTTELERFNVYGNCIFDIDIDVSNNPNLKYYKANVISNLFNASNHLVLETLSFKNAATLNSNINNTLLPNLTFLDLQNKVTTLDLTVRNLVNLTFLSLNCDNLIGLTSLINLVTLYLRCELNTTLSFANLTNLTVLSIANLASYVGVIDLKPLISLTSFSLNYPYHSSVTEIDIANGLNSQITNFSRLYIAQGYGGSAGLLDVRVDNAIDANNGTSPYLPTVWKKQYNSYEVLSFIANSNPN